MALLYYRDSSDGTLKPLSMVSADHGTMTGLADDDHPQYAKKADGVPAGTIVMFGSATPPAGWALCDGSAHGSTELAAIVGPNTPNLRDKFIVAAGAGFAQGQTGGAADHYHGSGSLYTQAISTAANWYSKRSAQSPSIQHSHIITGASGGTTTATQVGATGVAGNTAWATETGGNLPPFYALTYIIKKGAT